MTGDAPLLSSKDTTVLTGYSIEVKNVSFSRGTKIVLDDINLSLHPGELVSLIGPNGSGKSTLIALIAGDLVPDSGEILIQGKPVSQYRLDSLARRRALLEQTPSLAFNFTVKEVVQMGRSPWRGRPEQENDETIVREVMEITEITDFSNRVNAALSGGEAARMHISRVLAQRTQIILLDEPGAALDVRHQEKVMEIGKECASAGCTVVVVSHDLDCAATWSDRVALLDGGRVRACGAPKEVLDNEILTEVYRTPIEVLTHPRTGELMVRPLRQGREFY